MVNIALRIRTIPFRSLARTYSSQAHANLGSITEYLTLRAIPNLLKEPIDDTKLDNQIKLRLLPTTHPYMPTIQGINKYKHSMNAIRLIIRNFVLNERCRLHVTKVESFTGQDKCPRYNTITTTDKLVVHWQSCSEGCTHLGPDNVTSRAKFGLYKATDSQFSSSESNTGKSEIMNYIFHPGEKISDSMMSQHARPVTDSQWQISRVITGIFIFEMNDDNSKIVVHTIDAVEMSDDEKKAETGALAC
ncbi:LAFE_0B08614g1_1 [Lachancea fermentati]|uniref:LAFE_0B08614g1_1 n=1 Tax=Lachancea fermentati TaxID=4955 RepID=A0A1G4M8N7_LACFM|nr:LAFE_0B08614g1_1 [Lachancea fermentati]